MFSSSFVKSGSLSNRLISNLFTFSKNNKLTCSSCCETFKKSQRHFVQWEGEINGAYKSKKKKTTTFNKLHLDLNKSNGFNKPDKTETKREYGKLNGPKEIDFIIQSKGTAWGLDDYITPSKTTIMRFITDNDNKTLKLWWSDNVVSEFHYVWLRDSCQCSLCYHPQADEKLLSPLQLCLTTLQPTKVVLFDNGDLDIHWNDKERHETTLSSKYLLKFRKTEQIRNQEEFLWDSSWTDLPEIQYDEIMSTKDGRLRWLNMFFTYGFSLIKNVPVEKGISLKLSNEIAFPRKTFWGEDWSVKNTPNPANLSLTCLELNCHTDFSWSKNVPGVQFLHCLKNAGSNGGGHTTLVDGFQVAHYLKQTDPETFKILSSFPFLWYFRSKNLDYSYSGPVIEMDRGRIVGLRYNQANRGPIDCAPHLIPKIYSALQKFARLIKDPSPFTPQSTTDPTLIKPTSPLLDNAEKSFVKKFLLMPGDLLVFNNQRILHGRDAFHSSAERVLEGCYMDLEEVECHRRVLAQLLQQQSSQSAQQDILAHKEVLQSLVL